jgi:hypothetical protein
MRVTTASPLAHHYKVYITGYGLDPDADPFNKYRLVLVGRLAAADSDEGWVDQYQDDGSIKRIHGDVTIE